MASFGPLQSAGGVASSNFEFTHLSIHANLGGISNGGVVVYILKEKECKHFVFQPSSNELF